MSQPLELNERSDEAIFKEAKRRRLCKRKHECPHCGRRLDEERVCDYHNHNQPVPADIAQEAVLQELAQDIEASLPSRRGFALVVVRFGEEGIDEDPNALASYVSSLARPEAADLLLDMGMSIRKSLETKPI